MKYTGNNFDKISVIAEAVVELNPLRHISETIENILFYEKESKLIDAKLIELDEKAKLEHHQLDIQYKYEIKKLKDSRKKI